MYNRLDIIELRFGICYQQRYFLLNLLRTLNEMQTAKPALCTKLNRTLC